MNNRERLLAILNYQDYDRMPLVHFGYWHETLAKWADEGHISHADAKSWSDGNQTCQKLTKMLGFDFNYPSTVAANSGLQPGFETKVIKELPDGSKHILDGSGVVVLQSPEAGSIPAEIEHTLIDRASWEKHYKWRFAWDESRITEKQVNIGNGKFIKWNEGGKEFLQRNERDYPLGYFAGSLYGLFRNIVGVVGSSYMMLDDPELYDEILITIAELAYKNAEYFFSSGIKIDFVHYWEDICFKNGPLVMPDIFAEKVGPSYKRISELANNHGVDIISLDCDGCIDALLPSWLENGVNTMFPIEVGTWDASIAPWREQHGKDLRGIGGMNKNVFAIDETAIDAEIERLRPLIALGGFIPCPDHRIPPDAKWDLVKYYTKRMREEF